MAGLTLLVLALAGCGAPAPNQWQNIGPGSAQINTLASDPHIRGIIYAGGSDGTTYVARGDRSGQFVASNTSPGHGLVNVIFPNPYTDGTVYAGTAGGFYASSDYGQHYTARNSGLPADASVTAITTGPDANTLFASVAERGLYASADGGKTWTMVIPVAAVANAAPLPPNASVEALLWDSTAKALYAGVSGNGAGIYVSHDHGASWRSDTSGLPAKTDVYALIAVAAGGIAPAGPTLYAGTSAGVFALTSSAARWQPIGTGFPADAVYALATYPPVPGVLYAGTEQTVYSSSDGGRTWKKVAAGLAHAVPAIVVVPGEHTPTVTFVAAGQIARYPANAGGGDGGFLGSLIIIAVVGFAAWYILGRYGLVPGLSEVRRRISRRS
ncbi:MAG TPA: hypothetical protein VFU63_09845 [Ktedonobacterales bacterium]|nr:hypothetical protein [Ktedonobacterales bacterium]